MPHLSRTLLLSALLVAVAWATAVAQPSHQQNARGPVRMSVAPLTARPRSQAPQTVLVTLDSQLNRIVEGELQLRFYVGRRQVHEFHSGPLVLGSGPQRLRVLVPHMIVHHESTPTTVLARFVGTGIDLDLDEHVLVVPAYWKRWFVLGIPQATGSDVLAGNVGTLQALAVERFNFNAAERLDLVTSPAVLAPEDFPTTPAGYVTFDALLLQAGGFAQLTAVQLTAIGAWVEAGGSVCVAPGGALSPAHTAFLNRLAAENSQASFRFDERGRLEPDFPGAEGFAKFYCGLGRAVVLGAMPDPMLELDELNERALARGTDPNVARPWPASAAPWAEVATFLWKVRTDQTARIRETGAWDFKPPGLTNDIRRTRSYAPQESPAETNPRALLIPDRVQGIPLWVMLAILGLFLVVIAPLDYYLLGALRLRRLTWLFLAVVAIAFTVGTTQIADRVMGHADHQTALVFTDVGREGRPLRTSRLGLKFTATNQQLATPFRDTLFARWQDRLRDRNSPPLEEGYYVAPISPDAEAELRDSGDDLPVYEGRPPGAYVVRQQMRKWTPLVSRTTLFSPDVPSHELPWDTFRPLDWSEPAGRSELFDTILEALPDVQVLLFHQALVYAANGDGELKFGIRDNSPWGQAAQLSPPLPAERPGDAVHITPQVLEFVCQVSSRPDKGLFAILSQVSPTGADLLEDLAIWDHTHPAEWLLAVIIPGESEIHVVRRVYREGR